jgi:predicted ATPase/class 3 adenylate cyclase
MQICPKCGEENSQRARFCQACATPLVADAAPPPEARKTVTVVFSDVTGSTDLGERLDPESLRRVMSRYFEAMRQALERHGGTVEKFIGDAVMAVFGIPRLHEDDALRAVRATMEMRASLDDLNQALEQNWGVRLQIRTGVNTGEVVAGDPSAGQTLVTGDVVNVAARLEQAARPGEILMGEATYRLVRDAAVVERLESLTLKGKGEPVPALRLLEVKAGAPAFARHLDSPMVGRERERALLQHAFERCVGDRSCHLFTVLGAAGTGKSRLVEEFLSTVENEAVVLRGRCLPYGEGITFWPVREIVKQAARIGDGDTPEEARARIAGLLESEEDASIIAGRVAGAIGLAEAGAAPEETLWAVRKLLEVLAGQSPLVVLFDDIQWADPTFLDLVEHVADWSRDAPILLVCVARPELLDHRTAWGGGKLNASSILLEALGEQECERLIENLMGRVGLAPVARTRIVDASEGNPLFVEELLRMLIDDGLLSRVNGHWAPTGDLSHVPMPATIQALLAARLDRLEGEERRVIERAAVGGKVFYRGAVADLSPEPVRSQVGTHLMTLVRRELIRIDRSTFAGEEAFRFRHILIRDAAYDSMPKEVRAQLHEQFAAWLERAAGSRVGEYEEILGHHLEQAYRYRAELGPVDQRAASLASRAAKRLATAGRRARDRGDFAAAVNLLSRADGLLASNERSGLEILLLLAEVLHVVGESAQCESVLKEAVRQASEVGDGRLEAHGRVLLFLSQVSTDPEGKVEAARRELERIIPLFEQRGDDLGLARAWRLMAYLHLMSCRFAAVEESLSRAAVHARKAGDRWAEMDAIRTLTWALFNSATPAEEGIRRLEELLQEYGDSPVATEWALAVQSICQAMLGRWDDARSSLARARAIAEDLALDTALLGFIAGPIEMLAGDPVAAEREIRRSYDQFEQMGDKSFRSTLAALLADAIYAQGRYEEAERFTRLSEELAASDDIASQFLWRSIRAKVLAREGRFDQAKGLAREAVSLAEETDAIIWQGDVRMNLAEVLRLADRAGEAIPVVEEAVSLYEQKGNLVSAGRARDTLRELSST